MNTKGSAPLCRADPPTRASLPFKCWVWKVFLDLPVFPCSQLQKSWERIPSVFCLNLCALWSLVVFTVLMQWPKALKNFRNSYGGSGWDILAFWTKSCRNKNELIPLLSFQQRIPTGARETRLSSYPSITHLSPFSLVLPLSLYIYAVSPFPHLLHAASWQENVIITSHTSADCGLYPPHVLRNPIHS